MDIGLEEASAGEGRSGPTAARNGPRGRMRLARRIRNLWGSCALENSVSLCTSLVPSVTSSLITEHQDMLGPRMVTEGQK